MTEETFQKTKRIMQSANLIRGKITSAKNEIKRFTQLEGYYLEKMQPNRAEGARKCILKAQEKLKHFQDKFAAIRLPESNLIKEPTQSVQCEGCGASIAAGNTYCGECLCEEDSF